MKHWELEHNENHMRIEWNEAATFNFQMPIGGQCARACVCVCVCVRARARVCMCVCYGKLQDQQNATWVNER